MQIDFMRLVPIVCAGIGVVSVAVYFILKARELKTLRDIRDNTKPR